MTTWIIQRKGDYPTVKELKKAFNAIRDMTGNDNLPIVGGRIRYDTAMTRITVLKEDNTEWRGRQDGKAFGIFID